MKYIKLIVIAAFLSTMFTGCSYVSDAVEGALTDRASFGATAVYNGTNVVISWDKTSSDADFAGIEIYRTSKANDEYASYDLVASRHYVPLLVSGSLSSGLTTTCTVTKPSASGIYFYRVGFIKIGKDSNDVLYDPSIPAQYNAYTDIDAISGYAKVVIP